MADDPRLDALVDFTSTSHHEVIPEYLDPSLVTLPTDFTVCVVGAGKGIGEHIVYSYARAKVSHLILAARTQSDLEAVAENVRSISREIKVDITICDIASATSVSELAEFVKSKTNRLDLVICNAAYSGPVVTKMHEGEPEWVQKAFDVNTMGTYHVAHYFVPILLDSKNGAKMFWAIGSFATAIRRGTIANTGYTISKMAQTRIIEYLDEQYSSQGLFTISIHPGGVKTTMALESCPAEFVPYLVDNIALCGAVCVWLTARRDEIDWLSGRFIAATWNMEELIAKKEMVVERDLLKLCLAVD